MFENLIWAVTLVVVVAFVANVQQNIRKSKNEVRKNRAITHPSLYIPAAFPPWVLAMRDGPEEESPQQLHEDDRDPTSPSLTNSCQQRGVRKLHSRCSAQKKMPDVEIDAWQEFQRFKMKHEHYSAQP